ncbi:MAG: SusC/RagA family TonB-linked outer membrane protein [Bacteroidales bacterium]
MDVKKVLLLGSWMLVTVNLLVAQDSTIMVRGTVLSSSGKPVSDVTVSIEGSSEIPVVTDQSGKFTLQSPSGDVWIIVSPTGGFKHKRIYLHNRDHLTIYLTPIDVPSGHDEVNLLYQAFNKRNVVASFADLNTRNVHHTPFLSVDGYMQGRITGMHVVKRSGLPASGAVTMIRGVNSINATNQPLYVIDGIPLLSHGVFGSNLNGYSYNPLISVNPMDISRITIVKDPAISAAYGSKGSNGIIFIETLDPSATQTSIEFDIRGGYSLMPPVFIPQMNAQQHKTFMNEVLFTSPMLEEQIKEQYPNLFLTGEDEQYINYQHNTNWQKLIYQNAYTSNINLKLKGGDQIARYGLSFGYISSDGIIKNTGYDGYNLRFVSRLNIFSWLKMNAGVALNYSSSSLKESAISDQTSPILASLAKSPLLNPYKYDLEGRRLSTLAEVDELGTSNPLAIIDNFTAGNDNYNFISSLDLTSALADNLSVNSTLSLSYNVLKENIFMPNHGMELYYDQEAINVAKATNNSIVAFYNNSHLIYEQVFGDHHYFTSNTGINIYTNRYEMDWGLTKNAQENDQYRFLQDGQSNLREIGGQNRTWNRITIYENVNYAFKDKYLFSASISLDGSSRIGEKADNTFLLFNEPFGLFYGSGIGWRVSGEPFLNNIQWLEELKLRFSIGKSGNDDIGEASATNYYNPVKYRETAGLYPAVIPNDRLTFETVSQMNSGIDLSLWGNRISAKFDYFVSNTINMLTFSPMYAYLGYDIRMENGGEMKNRGWDFSSFIGIIDSHSFKWQIQTFLSSVNNQVTGIKGEQLITDLAGAQVVNRPGAPANSFYGYVYEGIYHTRDEASGSGLVNAKGMAYQVGDAMFADLSGPEGSPDGIINDYDKTIIGSSIPEYFGGLINSFSYRRWTLSGYVQFVYGNEIFNFVRYRNEQMTGLANQSTTTLNRWQHEGQDTDIPRALWGDPIGNSVFSTRWIEDGSYIRIKNITLSYRIPDQFLAFKYAEFYLSANNIFVISDYLGYDPEFAYTFSNFHQGIDYGLTPQPRQFIGGIKFGL